MLLASGTTGCALRDSTTTSPLAATAPLETMRGSLTQFRTKR